MGLPTCAGKTYSEILKEYLGQNYPQVRPHDLEQIHQRWKQLGQKVWKEGWGLKY